MGGEPQFPTSVCYTNELVRGAYLHASGFEVATSKQIDMTWELANAENVYPSFFTGTARTGALLRAQSIEAQVLIEKEIGGQAKFYSLNNSGIEVPMPAVLSCGRMR